MTNPILTKKGFAPQAIAIFSYAILLAGIITIAFSAYLVVVTYSSLPALGRLDPDKFRG
jgi:hypothetical protein